MITDLSLYFLENAWRRLQSQADCCRGTACDDEKVFGLEAEATAVHDAMRLLRRARENTDVPTDPVVGYCSDDGEDMIFRNPAFTAAAPLGPSGKFKEFKIGPSPSDIASKYK